MLIRPRAGRLINHRTVSMLAGLAAVLSLATSCARTGVIGQPSSGDFGKDFVGSVLSPTAPSAAAGGTHLGRDGGLTGGQSLPSFDNAPLPSPVTPHELPGPYTTRTGAVTGKLFFYRQGDANSGNYYVCSGTVIKSQNASLVWTAGHCVHDGKGGTWHLNMVFVPAFVRGRGSWRRPRRGNRMSTGRRWCTQWRRRHGRRRRRARQLGRRRRGRLPGGPTVADRSHSGHHRIRGGRRSRRPQPCGPLACPVQHCA